jgi:hypothetical protein
MGTRNLTMVISNGKTKVAQYGQWDGYPSGQGKTVLEFLKSADLEVFKKKLELVRFATPEDERGVDDYLEKIGCKDGWMNGGQAIMYHNQYPLLTRDNGAKILQMLYDNKKPVFIVDSSDFTNESLMCEWAYVLDLDNGILEVYSGFNKRKPAKKSRFYSDKLMDGYYPIKLLKKYSFTALPSVEQMVKDCKE